MKFKKLYDFSNSAFFCLAMVISIPFLLVTFMVYAIIPELRNLHGKSLLCFIGCLTIYFASFTITLAFSIKNRSLCTTLGYLIYYFGLATFFWLNAMCIEIFTRFVKHSLLARKTNDHKKLIKMALFGFGIPLIFTIIVVLLDHTSMGDIVGEKFRPKIGLDQLPGVYECFIQSKKLKVNRIIDY